MKISKRKITIWSIMVLSLIAVLSFVLISHFRTANPKNNPGSNLDYTYTNYVEINTGGYDCLQYDAIIDSDSGETTGYKVTGFGTDFTTAVSKTSTELYSLTIPAYHDGKPVVEIAIPFLDGSGNQFNYPTSRPADKPYETQWNFNIADQIGKVIVPKTVQKISPAAFNSFEQVREMELPFVGTERGNLKGSSYNHNTSSNCSFYAIFGTEEFSPMNDYDLNSLTTGGRFNTLEEMIDARNSGDTSTYGTGQIKWRFNADNDTNAVYFNVPIHLTNVFITDEYCIADHAFFFSPALKKVSIKWADNVPSSQIQACGFGRRVFDTSTALEMVILPSQLSSYGDGLFSHCLNLESVAVGGVETGQTSYTELNDDYPKTSDGSFLKQVHLPLESPVGVVPGSDIKINEDTFENCSSIVNMVIPHNVTAIEAHAFDNCTSMINVRPSSKNYSVGNYCDLPANLNSIGKLAFRNCTALENINVPTNVKTIEAAAFNRCTALKTLTLPFIGKERGNQNTVEALFGFIFGQYGNPDAGDTSASPDICTFQAVDGDPNESRVGEAASVPRGQFYIPSSLVNVVISDETYVSSGAFMNCKSLVSLQITSFEENEAGYSTMYIGKGALGGCINLENLSIPFVGPNEFMPAPANLKPTIRDGRGANTYQLGWIFGSYEYRDTTRIVQGEAFTSSDPAIYYFPSNLETVQLSHQTYIPSYSFWKTAMIKNVIIDDNTIASQREIFHGCTNLESLSVPFTGISRGLYWRNTGLMDSANNHPWYGDYWYSEDYYLRNSLIWLFSNRNTDEHYCNAGITDWRGIYLGYIPNALKSVTITDETYLETHALNGFTTLENVSIKKGNSVDIAQMHIDEGILANCGKIINLELPFIGRDYNAGHQNTRAYTIGWLFGNKYGYSNCRYVFQGVNDGTTYQIPLDLRTISFDDYITTIADGAFRGISSLESVKSNAIVSQLGNYAFADCTSLKEVVMPNASYTVMGNYAFANCVTLSEISAFSPATVRKIGHGALMGTSIKDIDFSKYYFIGDRAFSNCLQLTSVDLTNAGLNSGNTTGYLDYVGKYMFSGCTRLTDVKLKDYVGDGKKSVAFVSDYMFEGCSSLEDINLNGKLVDSVPNGFLKDCINLKSYHTELASDGSGNMIDKGLVLYPSQKDVKRIGAEAFKGCKSLTTFILPEQLVSIGNAAFQNCSGLDSMRIPRTTTSIPLGTESNGVDNYTTGVYYGCDENRFYLEVFLPESKWPWGANWNCYFPVNIIGDQNENLFTYEYCKELKGYLINGLNLYDATANPTGVDFAPNNHLLLNGTLTFPATYNGLTVYGLTDGCFNDYRVQAYEGSILMGRHPFAEVENFVLGLNFVTIGKDALNFDPSNRSTYRSVFSQKSAVQASKLGPKTCDCNSDNPDLKHTGISGLHYDTEEDYINNGIVYYKEAWTFTGVSNDSTPVYTMDALEFTFDSTTFQYNLGKEIKPRIVSIDVNDAYVKYPADNKDAFRRQQDDELYSLIYPDGATLDLRFLSFQYVNNINAGSARVEMTSNSSKIKGKRVLGFTITKRRVDVLNASLPDANYYGSLDGITPLSAQDHLDFMFEYGKDAYDAYIGMLSIPASKEVNIATKVYDGKPWQNSLWNVGTNLFGLPDGFSFSGTLQTYTGDAGHYWTDANVVRTDKVGSVDFYHTIDIENPDLWLYITYMNTFRWVGRPYVRDAQGRDVTHNFDVVVTGAVYIQPYEITKANLEWPGVFNGSYYEIEYTGLEIIPVPKVTNEYNEVLDPKFTVKVTSDYANPDHAIDPSERLYRSQIIGCDTRNFVFVTYDHQPERGMNFVDFKVVKAKLTITMDVVDYLIGINESEFSFDLANWQQYASKYHINIKGLGYGSVLGGTIHTTSSKEHGGWENQSVAIYRSGDADYKVEWSGASPFVVTNPHHDPVDITSFYEPILDVRVGIEWNRFDYNYTITDPTLSAPYVIKGVDRGMGIEVYEETPDMLTMRYGVDGYEHTLDIVLNNQGISNTIGDANYKKSFTYDAGSGRQPYSTYTIKNIITDSIQLDLSRDRFYPVSQTINLSTVKGSYVVRDLTKEFDRLAVDPYANLVRKPVDFDPTKLLFDFYYRTDRTYAEPLGFAPSAIGNYKYTMSTREGHSVWFNDADEWPSKEVNKNQADFEITRRSIYIFVVDGDLPYDSKYYDGEPWRFNANNTANIPGMVENLLDGDLLTGRFMSRDKEIGVYDGENKSDFIISTAMPWSVSNTTLGDQSDNYRIVFKGKYEIKPKVLDWSVENTTVEYDGMYYRPKVTVNDPTYGYTIYYSENPSVTLDSGDWSIYPPYKVEPGKYTIYVKVEAPYYQAEMDFCTIEIKGKELQWSVADQRIPYDGYQHGIDVTVTEPEYNYTIYYAILDNDMLDYNNVDPEDLTFRTSCPMFEDAGVYHYWVKVEAPNYKETEIVHVTLTIDNNLGTRQNIAIQDYSDFYDGKYHGPIFDLSSLHPDLTPSDLDISYYVGDSTVEDPTWISGSLEQISGTTYHLPILHDATDDPVKVTVRSKVLGYALSQATVNVYIKRLQLYLEPVSYDGIFDNKYHTVYLQTPTSSGHTLEILEEDLQAKVPFINYRYYFGTDKANDPYVDLDVRYSDTPAIAGNTSGFVPTPVRYKDSRTTPYQIFINVSAENCKDVYLHTGTVKISFNNNPTWSLKEDPVEIPYLARPVTLDDMGFETVHDGQPILTYYSLANPSVPIAAPIDLGEYRVEAVFPATKNCAKMEVEIDFKIVPRRLEIEYEKEHQYSGIEWVPDVYAKTNTTDTVLIHPYLEAGSNGIDLGDHYFYIEQEVPNGNYYIAPEDQRLMFTIIKRKLIVTFPDENGTKIHQYSIPPTKWTGTEDDVQIENLLPSDRVEMVMETTGTAARRYTTNGTFTYDGGNYINNWTGSNMNSNAVKVLILDVFTLDDGGSVIPATYYDVEVHLTVRIALPELDVTVADPTEHNYDNSYKTLDITMNTHILNYTVKYWPLTEEEYNELEDFDIYEDRDDYSDTFMHTDAGIYYVAYEINASNYEPKRGKARLIINKVALDIEFLPFEQIYDAQEHQVEYRIGNLFEIPSYPTPRKYYFSKKILDERRITEDDIRDFFEKGCPATSKQIYELWNKYTTSSMVDAGEYVVALVYDETLNWERTPLVGTVEIQKRPLYFNYNGDTIYVDSKTYDGDKLIMPSMALLSYDLSDTSGNKLPYSGLVKNHQILSTRMKDYSLRTSSADCRGDNYSDIPDLDPATKALWESPYQDKGDFEFHFFQVFYGASPEVVNTKGTNYADNYYPVVNKKNDEFQVQLSILRAEMTRFEVGDNEHTYNGKDAMPTIRTHANGVGDYVYYYYETDAAKNLLSTVPSAHATDVVDGYYQIYISVKAGRNYYQWNGDHVNDPNNGAAQLGSDYVGYNYKTAYVKVIPAEVRVNWRQLEGYFDVDEQGNVLNHDPQPSFTTVTGRVENMEYTISDGAGNPVNELKRAGSYGLSAHLAAYSDVDPDNYTFVNSDVTYTILKRQYTVSEVINDVWLHTNWTKTYTEEFFDSMDPEDLPWLPNFKLQLVVRANANTAGQLYSPSQFTATPKVTFIDPITGGETDYTDCYQFNLDLLVNLSSNDLIVEGQDIDVVFDNTYHYPKIQVLSYVNGYIISYYVMLVKEDGTYFSDWSVEDDPEKITYSEHLQETITYDGKTYNTFFDVARYRVFYRVTIGGDTSQGGTDDIVFGSVDVHIHQAHPTLDFGNTGLDRVYNGVAPTLNDLQRGISGHYNGRADQLQFTYYEAGGITPLDQAPVDVGDYVVVVTSTADDDETLVKNYSRLDASYNFSITPREMTLTVNTDWEVTQAMLDDTSLLWSSKVNDSITELANNTTTNAKYRVDVTNKTGLCSSDVLTFEIKSVNHLGIRGRYFHKSGNIYDGPFQFTTYDPSELFDVDWSVRYDDKGLGIVGNPDKTKNYVLKIDFNLIVHYPYIEINLQDKTYAYDGTPKDLLGPGKNIEIINPSVADCTILYGDRNNDITNATYERTEPGSYYAYFSISAAEHETYIGTTTLNITYQTRDDNLTITGNLNKIYDDVAYDGTTRPNVAWTVSPGEALPAQSTWKIEYFEAYKDNDSNYHKTGDALSSVIDAGDYIYRLTIPAGLLFSETVIERPFTISRRTYIITAPNPATPIVKRYDGRPWQYNLGSSANVDGFTFEPVPGVAESGLVPGHRLLAGTLITTNSDALTYSSNQAQQNRVQLQVNDANDYMIVDASGRDINEDNYAVRYNMEVIIEKGLMVVETNVDDNNQIPYSTEGFMFVADLKVPNGYQSKVMYSTDGGVTFSPDCPKFYQLGTNYQVIVKVEGIKNYEDFQKAYLFDIVPQQNTLEINVESRAYNGFAMGTPLIKTLDYVGYATSAPTPGVQVIWRDRNTGNELTSAPKDVGEYTVTVKYPTNSKYLGVQATKSFDITPLEISVSWTDTNLTYSGSVQYPTLHLSAENNATDSMLEGTDYTLTYTYNDMSAITTPVAGKAFDVGRYRVEFSLMPGTINYIVKGSTLTAEEYFAIKPRPIRITYTGKFDSVSDPTILLDQSIGLTITGLPSTTQFVGGVRTKQNLAGAYNVAGKYPIGSAFDNLYVWENTISGSNEPLIQFKPGAPITGNDKLSNYDIDIDIRMSIVSGELPYTVTEVDCDFDGQSHQLGFKLNYEPKGDYTIEYSTDTLNWQATPFTFTNVVDQHIYVRVKTPEYGLQTLGLSGSSDYDLFNVRINPLQTTLTKPNSLSLDKVYDDEEVIVNGIVYNTVADIDRSSSFTYKFYLLDKDGVTWIEQPFARYAGHYKVVIGMKTTPNFIGTEGKNVGDPNGPIEVEFDIHKRPVMLNIGTVSKVYDGDVWSGRVCNFPGEVSPNFTISGIPGDVDSGLIANHYLKADLMTKGNYVNVYSASSLDPTKNPDFVLANEYEVRCSSSADVDRVKNSYELLVNADVHITQAEFDVKAYGYEGPHDGKKHYVTIVWGTEPHGTYGSLDDLVSFRYDKDAIGDYEADDPGSSITSPVWVKIEFENYKTAFIPVNIILHPKETTINIDDWEGHADGQDKIYDGIPFDESKIVVSLPDGDTRTPKFRYYDMNDSGKLMTTIPVNAGEYRMEAYVDASDDGAYAAATSTPVTFRILPQEVTVTWKPDKIVKDPNDGKDYYMLTYNGKNNMPIPTAIGKINDPVEDYTIALDLELLTPVGATSATSYGTYSCKATMKNELDQRNYILKNDEVDFKIQKSQGGIIDPDPGTDIPQPDEDGYQIKFSSPITQLDGSNYIYKDLLTDGKYYVVTTIMSGTFPGIKSKVILLTVDLLTGEVIELDKAPIPADITVNFKFDIPYKTDKDGNFILDDDGNKIPLLTTELTPVNAVLLDKENTVWDSSGSTSDINLVMKIDKTTLDTDPIGPDGIPEIIVYDDYPNVHYYTGEEIKFPITVAITQGTIDRSDDIILEEGVDYEIIWINNIAPTTSTSMASFVVKGTTSGGYDFKIGDETTADYTDDAGTFSILNSRPGRLEIKADSIYKFVYLDQNFETFELTSTIYTNEERTALYDTNTVEQVAQMPLRLGHTHQGQTILHLLNQLLNDSDDIVIYSADPTITVPIYDKKDPNCDYEKVANETIITNGMKIVLYDHDKPHTNENQRDIIEVLLKGDVNSDGFININDITDMYKYITDLDSILTNPSDKTPYSIAYQAGLLVGDTSTVNINDITLMYKHIEAFIMDENAVTPDDINYDYNPNKPTSSLPQD